MGSTSNQSAEQELASAFTEQWATSGTIPDVLAFLKDHPKASPRPQADVLLIDRHERWQRGMPRPLEDYFAACPDVAAEENLKLELIQ